MQGKTPQRQRKALLIRHVELDNLLHEPLTDGLPAKSVGEMKLFFDTEAMSDLWIAATWSE